MSWKKLSEETKKLLEEERRCISYLLNLLGEIKEDKEEILEKEKGLSALGEEELDEKIKAVEDKEEKYKIAEDGVYESVYDLEDGVRIVKKGGEYNMVNKDKREVLEEWLEGIERVGENLFAFKKGGRWGLMNEKGDIIKKESYDEICDFHEGYARVQKNGERWLLNSEGKVINSEGYSWVTDVSNGYFWYNCYGQIHIRDISGKISYSADWRNFKNLDVGKELKILKNGWTIIGKTGEMGLLNNQGDLVIPRECDKINYTDDGLFEIEYQSEKVLVNEKMLNDREGETIVPKCSSFHKRKDLNNCYSFFNYGCEGLVDGHGNIIVPLEKKYGSIGGFDTNTIGEKFAVVKNLKGDCLGVIDSKGKERVPLRYKKLELVKDSGGSTYFSVVRKATFGGEKKGYVDLDGNKYFGNDAEKLKLIKGLC